MELGEIYPYKYETHMHTSASSACGCNTPEEMVEAYKNAGYAGIIITDHHYGGNTAIDRKLPWEEWVEQFCNGYERAKAHGDKIGLQVFFGWEAGFRGTEFLVYGLDKQWMKEHPEIRKIPIEDHYNLVKDGGGFIVHAHPFRVADYISEIRVFPHHVDAVEGYNTSHWDETFNENAIKFAKENNLPITCGSDQHTINLRKSGVCFKTKVKDINDLIDRLIKRDYCIFDGKEYIKP